MVIAQKMGAVQVRLDEAQKRLIIAATEFKVIEKLKENHWNAWKSQS